MRAMRAKSSGSLARIHSSFGAVKPGSARLPVSSIRRERPIVASISLHSAAVRWSFQRIAGRSTRPGDGVLAAEARLPATCDGGGEVLELARVRVAALDLDALDAVGAAKLDHRGPRVPGIVEPDHALGSRHFELVARGHVQAAVD